MATTVITGRDVTFTIGGNTFDAQATSAVLTGTTNRQTYETLDGKAYKVIDNDFTLAVEMLADWGVPSWPSAGGAGNDAQTVSLTFQVIGVPAESFS